MTTEENSLIKKVVSGIWWIILLRGLAALLLGLWLFTNTASAITAIFIFLGIYWLIDGIFTLISAYMGKRENKNWGWGIFSGIISVVAGLLVLSQPLLTAAFTATFLVMLAGILIVISGISSIVTGIRLRKTSGEWTMILSGILISILGLLLLFNPLFSARVFVQILGIFSIIGGIALIALAVKIKNFKNAIS